MAKKEIQEEIVRIKKAIEENKEVIGTKQVKSGLMNNELKEVIISSNCPVDVKEDLQRVADINGTLLTVIEQANDELGVVCKKPYSIAVMAIKND